MVSEQRPPISAQAALELAKAAGFPAQDISPVSGFVGNANFWMQSANGAVVYMKVGQSKALKAEHWALEKARHVGVLVPDSLYFREIGNEGELSCLISRALPGKPVPVTDHTCLKEAGRSLGRLHTVPMAGYGYLNEANLAAQGCLTSYPTPFSSWSAFIASARLYLPELCDEGVIPLKLANNIDRFIERLSNEMSGYSESRLMHGDAHPRHIYASSTGSLSGFLDWGDAVAGDPLYEFGRFRRADTEAVTAVMEGYGLACDVDTRRRVTQYSLLWSVFALYWEYSAGGDWFHEHLAALEGGLQFDV